MDYTIILPSDFPTMDVRTLLEEHWLIPRKVRHFLRIRRNVWVNNAPALFHHPVHSGDTVTLYFEETDYVLPQIPLGTAENVQCIYEDEHLLIVNKPSGCKTHPNQPGERHTLLNDVAAYLEKTSHTPYVVHRLDKETSGAILFAKNPIILPILGRMLEKKEIRRVYQAVVSGILPEDHFKLTKKIGRDRHDRRKRCVDEKNGKLAITHLKVVQRLPIEQKTRVSCWLETGRTHQIRVHLQSLGFPIVGDPLYQQHMSNPQENGRLLLHAQKLELLHPFTGQKIEGIASPELW